MDSQVPFALNFNAILPAAILPIAIGINNGDTLEGPFSFNLMICSSIVHKPPIPEPTIVPNLFESISSSFNPLIS